MSFQPGDILHQRYRIVKMLGQGGFGTMYRAWDTVLGHVCALKENRDPAEEIQRQFLREAKLLANLNHPGLPRVTDYFIEGAGQYLVMDFVDGQDLQEILEDRGTPLPEDQALAWIRQVCDALTYLHTQKPPVIHRDVKPGNIKITSTGQAVLVDFGIAKVHDPSLKTTLGAQAVSPGYSPYEQYGKGTTDPRSDVYALGATLYTLLTGVEPPESVQRMTRDPLALVRQLNPNITVRTASAVMRALQMDPTQRFQSVTDFKAALSPPARPAAMPARRSVQSPAATPAAPVPLAKSIPAWPGRFAHLPVAGLALVGVLLLAAILVLLAQTPRATPAPAGPAALRPTETNPQAAGAATSPATTAASGPTRTATRGPTPTPFIYTVQAGDTCSEIAANFDVSVAAIAAMNNLPPDCGVIYAGQRLRIPLAADRPTVTPTASPTRTRIWLSETQVSAADGMVLISVPAGEFWMGADENDAEASRAERPQHKVSLRGFWIDRTEITNAMYARCVQAGDCRPPAQTGSKLRRSYFGDEAFADFPVIFVDWQDAQDYCRWAGRRLPTEAEWEKAARGPNGGQYPWGNQPPSAEVANFNNQVGDTRPTGSYPLGASPYGALDMSGNVAEWVADWFSDEYYQVATFANPIGPESGEFRVIRGGSWFNLAGAMRSAFRLWNYPDLRSDTVGFRCAR